jgi:GT2 family glycosyltransferase
MSVVFPSYQRGRVVLDSIQELRKFRAADCEVLVVDQTLQHPEDVAAELEAAASSGEIRWVRLPKPSIPHAMNVGLREARGDVVLFLDDDIVPDAGLIEAHRQAQAQPGLVAGMVLQPGQVPSSLQPGESFRFNSTRPDWIEEFMGGNFSISRSRALELGGFDENFVGAAYRFEAEFASRFVRAFGKIRYEPSARLNHLAVASGGTRAHGHHLKTTGPGHSVGAFYYLLRVQPPGWRMAVLKRPFRAVRTRHHLRRPWWIPLTFFSELRGLALALRLSRSGPRLLEPHATSQGAI